jgi:hypothetical protein
LRCQRPILDQNGTDLNILRHRILSKNWLPGLRSRERGCDD